MAKSILARSLVTLIAIPILSRVAHRIGQPPALLLSMFIGGMAAWPKRHTAESAAMAEDISGALADIGLKQEAAAIGQGITAPQFSAQLQGRETLNASRLASLGAAFRIAWATRMLKREGVDLVTSHTMLQLVDELRSLVSSKRSAA